MMGHFGLWITPIGGPDHGIFSGMSFEQLPRDWPDRPLTDPVLAANVVDLMVSLGDRHQGAVAAIVCDPDARYRATVVVELPPSQRPIPAHLCRTALEPVVTSLQSAPGTSVVLALGCPVRASADDVEWAATATAICAEADIRLLGFYVATGAGVHQPLIAALT